VSPYDIVELPNSRHYSLECTEYEIFGISFALHDSASSREKAVAVFGNKPLCSHQPDGGDLLPYFHAA